MNSRMHVQTVLFVICSFTGRPKAYVGNIGEERRSEEALVLYSENAWLEGWLVPATLISIVLEHVTMTRCRSCSSSHTVEIEESAYP
jgi:hypothetical protein